MFGQESIISLIKPIDKPYRLLFLITIFDGNCNNV
jgi:hypothetical protein